jgi:hypothetical protein
VELNALWRARGNRAMPWQEFRVTLEGVAANTLAYGRESEYRFRTCEWEQSDSRAPR